MAFICCFLSRLVLNSHTRVGFLAVVVADNNTTKSFAVVSTVVFIMASAFIYTLVVVQMICAKRSPCLGKCGCVKMLGHFFAFFLPLLLFACWVVGAAMMVHLPAFICLSHTCVVTLYVRCLRRFLSCSPTCASTTRLRP